MRTGILDEARPRRARLSQRSKITKVTKAQGVASADHRRDPLDRWARASGKARKLNLKIETRQGDAAVMQDLSKSAPRLIFLLSHICVSNWSRLRIRHVTLSNIPRLCMQYVTFVSQICRVCVSNMSPESVLRFNKIDGLGGKRCAFKLVSLTDTDLAQGRDTRSASRDLGQTATGSPEPGHRQLGSGPPGPEPSFKIALGFQRPPPNPSVPLSLFALAVYCDPRGPVQSAMGLSVCYAMSGTDVAYGIGLRTCYVIPGTGIAYAFSIGMRDALLLTLGVVLPVRAS
eukprot:905236-Rhodomonas_salina.5